MTVKKALSFINRGMNDNILRRQLNSATSPAELSTTLSEEDLIFSERDFEEAYYQKLAHCQIEEHADQLNEFKLWWELLSYSLSPAKFGVSNCGNCPI